MRSNSLDSKLRAKEVELKRHEQEIADQDEVYMLYNYHDKNVGFQGRQGNLSTFVQVCK